MVVAGSVSGRFNEPSSSGVCGLSQDKTTFNHKIMNTSRGVRLELLGM